MSECSTSNRFAKRQKMQGDEASWVRPDETPKCTWNIHTHATQKSPHTVYKTDGDRTKTFSTVLEAIGNTPLVRLSHIEKEYGLKCQLLAKCEFFNAGGSVKDRIGLRMMVDAEREGRIKPGYTIIEPTSGNTGVGLALACAVKGYRCIIVMPEKMSMEKVNVLKALGAEIIRTPTSARFDDPVSHIRVAQKLEAEIPNAVILDQYRNPGNPLAHYDTTAEEILQQCGGEVDMVVGGAGTGGTITGIGRKFKEKCPSCQIIAVDPEGSDLALPPELNKTDVTYYEVEGIGYDFVPTVFDRSVIDKWYKSKDKESLVMARKLIRSEGLLCGGSSGTAAYIAVEAAKKLKEGQKCVVILPDSIRNYMTKHLMEDWMIERDMLPVPESEQKWWSNKHVSDMELSTPVTILPSTTCKDAMAYMEGKCFDQLPVVDSEGSTVGIVTMGGLTSNFSAEKVKMSDPVSNSLYRSFKKIKTTDSLALLSRLLDSNHFVVVMGEKLKYDQIKADSKVKNMDVVQIRKDTSKSDGITGIVTSLDFLRFISKE